MAAYSYDEQSVVSEGSGESLQSIGQDYIQRHLASIHPKPKVASTAYHTFSHLVPCSLDGENGEVYEISSPVTTNPKPTLFCRLYLAPLEESVADDWFQSATNAIPWMESNAPKFHAEDAQCKLSRAQALLVLPGAASKRVAFTGMHVDSQETPSSWIPWFRRIEGWAGVSSSHMHTEAYMLSTSTSKQSANDIFYKHATRDSAHTVIYFVGAPRMVHVSYHPVKHSVHHMNIPVGHNTALSFFVPLGSGDEKITFEVTQPKGDSIPCSTPGSFHFVSRYGTLEKKAPPPKKSTKQPESIVSPPLKEHSSNKRKAQEEITCSSAEVSTPRCIPFSERITCPMGSFHVQGSLTASSFSETPLPDSIVVSPQFHFTLSSVSAKVTVG